jgi:hypothetical protein
MTESANPKQQRYHLRLTKRFVFYDPDCGSPVWREWPEGAVITDPDAIKIIETHDALFERIDVHSTRKNAS